MLRPCLGVEGQRCPRLLERGRRCEPCRVMYERGRKAARPSWEVALYTSRPYRALRLEVLNEAGWRCHWCNAPADTVDHVRKVRERPDLGLSRDNLVAACRSCQEIRKRPDRYRQPTLDEQLARLARR
jgi:5-methylcytosine-specific restriction endonuclease McrA